MPRHALLLVTLLATASPLLAAELPGEVRHAEEVGKRAVVEAGQGVAVDAEFFYAIDNWVIAKYRKDTGEQVARWEGAKDGPIIHLDGGVALDGKIYAPHSNYPGDPMTSSVEIWDAATMQHVASHSFGIQIGSLTWIDRDRDGVWWGAFANYNRVFGKSTQAYGNKYRTQIVRFGADWRIEEAYVLPDAVVDRFADMSNSGGSFGPDGLLYITGHDNPELYALRPPEVGSVMRWVDSVTLDIAGQGFAWDRSAALPTLYGIIRGETDPENLVTVHHVPLRPDAQQRASAQ